MTPSAANQHHNFSDSTDRGGDWAPSFHFSTQYRFRIERQLNAGVQLLKSSWKRGQTLQPQTKVQL